MVTSSRILALCGVMLVAASGCASPDDSGVEAAALEGTGSGGSSASGSNDPTQGNGGSSDGAGGYESPDTGGAANAQGTGGDSTYQGSGGGLSFGTGGSANTTVGTGGASLASLFPPAPPPAAAVDAGSCANMACFDVFDCAIFHPGNSCAFTQCVGFVCKK